MLATSLGARRQLGRLGGLTDEWVMLGANIAVHATLGLENEPWLLRPPGYPAFIAIVLLLAGPPPVVTVAYLDRAAGLVYAAQAGALALAAVLLFLWLSEWMRPGHAFAAAVVLALNPLSVVLVGLLQYGVVHVLALVAGLWALDRGVRLWPQRRFALALAGGAWGVATLVRPVTLLLPPFVLLALVLRRSRLTTASALAATFVFSGAAAAVIAPWTLRNHLVSGELVPVNLQGRANLWAATVKPLPVDADVYRWQALDTEQLLVYRRVTGRPVYDLLTYVRFNAELEEAYGREAWENLQRRPGVYLRNVAGTLRTLLLDMSTVLLPVFRLAQSPEVTVAAAWFNPGAPPPPGSSGLRTGLRGLIYVLSLLAVVGVVRALRARAGPLWATSAVAACLLAAHALVHMDFTYYYVKLPFLVVLGFGGLGALERGHSGRLDPTDVAAALLALGAVGLTVLLLRP